MNIKESRKFDMFVGVQYGSKKFNTPQALARHISYKLAYRVVANHARRHAVVYDWEKRERVYKRAYKRILPRCKWLMQRK